ncbi:MAG: hypothetical protein H6R04_1146 [Burkholderiaceae bacterium]|nr:hypothetical protein [Burkholderiaceae bacterium]
MSTYLARKIRQPAFWFWLAITAIWLVSLNFRALIHADEGRYASISMGMLQTGDWISPRLNDILYFEKPILQYWASSMAFLLFGFSEFAARFWPGLTGLLTILTVGLTGRRLWDERSGHLAAIICAGTTWIIGNSHFLTLDMGVTFFLTLSLCAFLLAQHDDASAAERRNMMLLAWAAMAGATLSKGLIGLLIPGATLFIYTLVQRQFAPWRRMQWLAGCALFLLLTVPWFWLVSERNPGFAHFFFIHEHFERFLNPGHSRPGPFWYFVPVLLAGFLPWTTLLPRLVRDGWQKKNVNFDQGRFLLIWCVFIFVFFSKSSSKLPSYILPMFPALALLLGYSIARLEARQLRLHLCLPAAIWALALMAIPFIGRFASSASPAEMYTHFGWYLASGAIIFLAGAFVAWRWLSQGRLEAGMMAVTMTSLLAVTTGTAGHEAFGQVKSSRNAAETIRPYLAPETQIFSVRMYDQTFPYYLRRPVTLVEYVGEFNFGQKTEPERWIGNMDDFVSRWQASPSAVAMLRMDIYQELAQRGLPMKIIYQDVRRMVVAKP